MVPWLLVQLSSGAAAALVPAVADAVVRVRADDAVVRVRPDDATVRVRS